MNDLFKPINIGAMPLSNRIVMSPMTRNRVGQDGVPGHLNAEYYSQRASAGLIVSEGSNISLQGRGYAYTPGIFNEAQVAGWRLVTDAVHAAGGLIVCQLWHVGRISHPSLQEGGALPVAPSAIRPVASTFTEQGFEACVTPRALELNEIPAVLEQYRHATECAKRAGFDGVEIFAGGGYLIDSFLRDRTNQRKDQYGGSIENRVRFLREVTDTVISAWQADRVGVRLGPNNPYNDIGDSDPESLFLHVAEQLNAAGVAYIHVSETATPDPDGPRIVSDIFDLGKLRAAFKGAYIANDRYDFKLATKTLQEGKADLISFGRPFISNPDLVERFRTFLPLATPNRETFYGGDGHGYTDYPALALEVADGVRP